MAQVGTPLPVDPNQTTTKPRQIPSGDGGGNLREQAPPPSQFDPTALGAPEQDDPPLSTTASDSPWDRVQDGPWTQRSREAPVPSRPLRLFDTRPEVRQGPDGRPVEVPPMVLFPSVDRARKDTAERAKSRVQEQFPSASFEEIHQRFRDFLNPRRSDPDQQDGPEDPDAPEPREGGW